MVERGPRRIPFWETPTPAQGRRWKRAAPIATLGGKRASVQVARRGSTKRKALQRQVSGREIVETSSLPAVVPTLTDGGFAGHGNSIHPSRYLQRRRSVMVRAAAAPAASRC